MHRLEDVITFTYYFPKNDEKRNYYKNGNLMKYQIILKAASCKLIVSEMDEMEEIREINILYLSHYNRYAKRVLMFIQFVKFSPRK